MEKHPRISRRRGTVVHEAAIAMILAAAVLTSVVQVLAFFAQQSRSQHERLTATREAGDLMERLMARSWEQLTPEAAAAMKLSEHCQATLPNAQLDIDIASSDVATDNGAKQLNIEISWRHAAGNQAAPVHLVAWKTPRQETDE